MARALKVYRTAIGFHDAYVAAPTQKAALAAWGSSHDLFARGQVEIVTDAALTAAALATPGVVVKTLRGTAAEQVAALPPGRKRMKAKTEPAAEPKPKPKTRPPRPSRQALEKAEAAEAAAAARHDAAMAALAKAEAALVAKRRRIEAAHDAERMTLATATAEARAKYEGAVERWDG